jgi:hypothetical protein
METLRLSLTQEDLERFFGTAPSKSDIDVPWPYNGLTFNFSGGPYQVIFYIMPSYRHVELSIRCANELTYQLTASTVSDLRVLGGPTHGTLEIVISSKDSVFIRLLPSVLVAQQVGGGT